MTALTSLRVRLLVLFGVLSVLIAATAFVFLARAHQTRTTSPQTNTQPVPRTGHTRTPARTPVPAASEANPIPPVVHRALESHRVVVVTVVVGGGAAEAAAVTEARAGAASIGAGFLRVDVGHQGLAKQFATLFGGDTVMPATLVVKRPGSVFLRLDGYNDRLVVAQAARNA